MKNQSKNEFLTTNEVIRNIAILWEDMTEDEKKECAVEFFGLENKEQIIMFVEKYTPIKY